MSIKMKNDEVIQNTVYDVYENYDESKSTVDEIILPERDKDKTPILEIKGLGIDFGGLTAVDEFTLSIGLTEIAGIIDLTAQARPPSSTCLPRYTSLREAPSSLTALIPRE